MCEGCGTPNYVLKARRIGMAAYTVKRHEPRCASFRGRICDCDPELAPVAQSSLFDGATSGTPPGEAA